MDSRYIPPLTSDELTQVTEMKQLQVMIRHGARTPYALYSCWNNYNVTWNNCNVTELMLASPSYNSENRPATWLFRKLYDGSPNYLGGNCLTGQLLLEGYQQEEANGDILYQAYLNPISTPAAMRLFDTDDWEALNEGYTMYLRSDDEQRTLMSGQILLHNMFNVSDESIVTWHTGDYNLDQIRPNTLVCPRLNNIESTAYSTSEWVSENTSTTMNQLTSNLTALWGEGMWSWNNVLDCLMTTVCTGRDLPSASPDNSVQMSDAIFNATVEQIVRSYAYILQYNNSFYARTGIGHTVWRMREHLIGMINGSGRKFVLVSGHDSTLMPFLAAVLPNWDGDWSPYASMLVLEVYAASMNSPVGASGYMFRIIYNGKVLRLPGCEKDLCELAFLLDAFDFAQKEMPCDTINEAQTGGGNINKQQEACSMDSSKDSASSQTLSMTGRILLLLVGMVSGAFAMNAFFKHSAALNNVNGGRGGRIAGGYELAGMDASRQSAHGLMMDSSINDGEGRHVILGEEEEEEEEEDKKEELKTGGVAEEEAGLIETVQDENNDNTAADININPDQQYSYTTAKTMTTTSSSSISISILSSVPLSAPMEDIHNPLGPLSPQFRSDVSGDDDRVGGTYV
eukprot:CAMPEP_0174993948 /NCGR_PEP_ID=MMETSP0004_2-20121128/23356_1 /TAXON_ID=420556 /ORGANISM="Ochromonas sp., Strain CCMP1393" /LENGTH=625 /DNA_ID=CAMNT_0016248115 /DNA_START=39 /DNA_END=1916 /DNA_ORIENTATION=-